MPLTTIVQGLLANNAVTSASISANNVQTVNIASSAVVARNIASYEIQTYHLSSNSVDSRTIASSAITTRHYAASSVQNIHMAANSVSTSNLTTSAVTIEKLNADVITTMFGSRVWHNTRSTVTFTNTNYLTAHGAIIINKFTAGVATILFDGTLPSNFHCWVLNASTQNLNLQCNAPRLFKFDKRRLVEQPSPFPTGYSCVLTGAYFDGSAQQALTFVYVFIGEDLATPAEVYYTIPLQGQSWPGRA